MSAFGAQLEWLLRWLRLDVERLPPVSARVVRGRGDARARHRRVAGACVCCLLLAALCLGILLTG